MFGCGVSVEIFQFISAFISVHPFNPCHQCAKYSNMRQHVIQSLNPTFQTT